MRQYEVMSFRSCGCIPRMRSIKSPGLRRPFLGVRGVMVVPSYGGLARGVTVFCDRRPTLSCILHTRAKDSAQTVKPDVCRCAAVKKKHIPSSAISTMILSIRCSACLAELSEWKGHSGGTRVLNEHVSVLNVMIVTDFASLKLFV